MNIEEVKGLKEDDKVICKNYGFQSAVQPNSMGYFVRWADDESGWPVVRFQCGSIQAVDPADISATYVAL